MTTTAHRTLTEADYRAMPDGLSAGRLNTRPTLDDFLTLGDRLMASGYGSSDALTHLRELRDAAWDASSEEMPDAFTGIDPHNIGVKDVKGLLRHAALTGLLRQSMTNMLGGAAEHFADALRPYAIESFASLGDAAVKAMRPEFDTAAKTVAKAHAAGVTPHTTLHEIATTAEPKQVTAWRSLSEAITTLDRLADLRIRIHNLIAWDNPNPDSAITTILADIDDIDTAARHYRGNLETVLVASSNPSIGPAAKQVARPRTGGAWLSLIAANYKPALALPSERP